MASEHSHLHVLRYLAQEHVDKSRGMLTLLPVDPETYPAQNAYHAEGNPQTPDAIDAIAEVAEPSYPAAAASIRDARHQHILDEAGEIIERGDNLIIVTNHSKLTDIAIAQAALYGPLKERAAYMRSAIIIGKMISVVAYKFGEERLPAVDALKLLCDDIFLSFPRTASLEKSGLETSEAELITRNNRKMRAAVARKLGKGGLLLAVAPSGTTDKLHAENGYTLGKVGAGTGKMLCTDKAYVLPVAVWLDSGNTILEPTGTPQRLTSQAAVHEVMSGIAATLDSQVPGKKFTYQK